MLSNIESEKIKCELKLDSGFNSIVLGVSTLKEIETYLGEGNKKIKKYPIGGLEFNFLPQYENQLHYPEIGITFANDGLNFIKFLFNKKIAIDMYLSNKCHCKTKEGLGIGMTLSGVEEITREAYYYKNKSQLSISFMKNESYIELYFKTFQGIEEPVVDSIWIHRYIN